MKPLDRFTQAYIECLLWSSTDDAGEPLDRSCDIAAVSPEALDRITQDCHSFQEAHGNLIRGEVERAGHDFWLTRNGHGAGFWDGDWPKEAGEILTKASKTYGEQNPYVGDDGKIYLA